MLQAYQQFEANITAIKELDALYAHLHNTLQLPNDLSDLLRAELVYAVSALDKLIHDLVKTGMTETFIGSRNPTNKYKNFSLSMSTINDIRSATIPPAEVIFGSEVFNKNKTLSFQKPDKIADALSYIWNESHKWQSITSQLGLTDQKAVREKLKAIVDRRDQIVHEADLDYNGEKNIVIYTDISDSVEFIKKLGKAIYTLVN